MARRLAPAFLKGAIGQLARGELPGAAAPAATLLDSSWSQLQSRSSSNAIDGKVLHPDLLNENVKKTQYAVRGELYIKAQQLQQAGKEITFTNVGNPHALGAKPLTFPRQVISLMVAPFLLDHPKVKEMFPEDAIERARRMLNDFKGGVGAYSDSKGNAVVRQEVAQFIQDRDGHPASPENIFLTDGASVAVRLVLSALIRNDNDVIMVPIPQYPLYSASIALYGGTMSGYYLDEAAGWAMTLENIKSQIDAARKQGKNVRALVYINPGNPTGQCLSYDNLKEIVKFAHEENLVLMADEVYQENVYQDERPFIATKKVLKDMGPPYSDSVELVSFHTVSKGTAGECGLRGGYLEATNIHPEAMEEMYKLVSINLSPNTIGQASMSLMVNPPKPGSQSYELYKKERQAELDSLRRRAHMVTDAFNEMEGFACNFVEGAMYAFPTITLPAKAVEAAKAAGKAPDVFYCLRLLEATGISTVPGSGFGQAPGSFHLRTTILPREEKMEEFCKQFKEFNKKFMAQYS